MVGGSAHRTATLLSGNLRSFPRHPNCPPGRGQGDTEGRGRSLPDGQVAGWITGGLTYKACLGQRTSLCLWPPGSSKFIKKPSEVSITISSKGGNTSLFLKALKTSLHCRRRGGAHFKPKGGDKPLIAGGPASSQVNVWP